MRVVIHLSFSVKQAAELQAQKLGYASLAGLLKVTATLLGDRVEAAALPEQPALLSSLKMMGKLPHPDQFAEWPPHVCPTIATTDPDLYAFYIQTGIIR
ncbi:MAG TPA: hypothetical protein VF272_03485 [Candidatus Saccharimonadia bacterium]